MGSQRYLPILTILPVPPVLVEKPVPYAVRNMSDIHVSAVIPGATASAARQ